MNCFFKAVRMLLFSMTAAAVAAAGSWAAAAVESKPDQIVEWRVVYEDGQTRAGSFPADPLRVPGMEENIIFTVWTVRFYLPFPEEAREALWHGLDPWRDVLTGASVSIDAYWQHFIGPEWALSKGKPSRFHRDFFGALQAGTWYPAALANFLACSDLDRGNFDIEMRFNSSISAWYMGTDGKTPAGRYDFATVASHTLGHGLGFGGRVSFISPSVTVSGDPSIYTRFVENGAGTSILDFTGLPLREQLQSDDLYFDGPQTRDANAGLRARLHAPSVLKENVSYENLREESYPPGNPNSLMTPHIDTGEPIDDVGPIVRGMLADMGWSVERRNRLNADLKVNGTDGPVTINRGDDLTLTATLRGGLCQEGDYFLVARYKGVFWAYRMETKSWFPGRSATYQGRLLNLTDNKLYSSTTLPPGRIDFFLVVDTQMDGVPNFDSLLVTVSSDKVVVEVLK